MKSEKNQFQCGYKMWLEFVNFLVFVLSVDSNHVTVPSELTGFSLSDVRIHHAHLRCLQKYPQAEIINYTDTLETQCFLHCVLYKVGLMDLSTRGLDDNKFMDIWDQYEEAFSEYTCFERFDFGELLSGNCSDSYRKLMGLRSTCVELFEFIFGTNRTSKLENSKHSKKLGQSATEFCDVIETEDIVENEDSQNEEVPLLTQYKEKLECIFDNIHYLDAYGRVDESEINLSYQEAQEDSSESRSIVGSCSHRANSKFQTNYRGTMVLELQKCLKAQSTAFDKVFKLRDENSRQY